MTAELKKRIITSILLFVTVILCTLNIVAFMLAAFVTVCVCFSEWSRINAKHFKKKIHYYNWYLIINFFALIYLFIFFSSAIGLRGHTFQEGTFFIIILCICICSDVGGYIFGKTIGGKKLIKISPNKTISGSIGSFISSLIPLFLFNFQNYTDFNFDLSLKNILFCLVISLSCQIGDLIISYFKRLNKVKDTGTILPGHGGLLDRIDGIIFAIPTVYILKITQIF